MTPALSEAAFFAATTLVLCLTAAEFGMLNLAAGMWVILGGWLGNFLVAGTGVPGNFQWAVTLIAAGLVIQTAAPFLLGEHICSDPLRYVFVALGVSMALHGFAATFVVDEYDATLPIQPGGGFQLVLLAALLAVVSAIVICVFRSKRWTRTVILSRVAAVQNSAAMFPARAIAGFSALEIVMLLCIGALSPKVHQGLIGTHETLAIVPILSIVASGGKWFLAPVMAAAASLTENFLVYQGGWAASYAKAIKWAVVVLLAVIGSLGRKPILRARGLTQPPSRSQWWRAASLSLASLCVATAFLLTQRGRTPDVAHSASIALTLSLVAWFGLRFLGIATVAWPMIGVSSAYLWAYSATSNGGTWVSVAAIGILLIGWSVYLLLLRLLSEERSLAVDLAVVLCLGEFFRTATWISGANHVIDLSAKLAGAIGDIRTILFQAFITTIVILLALALYYVNRPISFALVDPRLGWKHGFSFPTLFVETAIGLVVLAQASAFAYYSARSITIGPEQASVSSGLVVLLFGGLMHGIRFGVPVGIFAIVIVRTILQEWMSNMGLLLDAVIGLSASCGILLLTRFVRTIRHD